MQHLIKNKTASPCILSISCTWIQGLVSMQVSCPLSNILCVSINGKNRARILFYTKVRKFQVGVAIPTITQALSSYEFLLLLMSALNFYALKPIRQFVCLTTAVGFVYNLCFRAHHRTLTEHNIQNSSFCGIKQ